MSEEANFEEDHTPMNLKLAVYGLLNVIGASTAAYGYFIRPWERVRLGVGLGAALYLLLTVIWTLFTFFFQQNTTFRSIPTKKTAKKEKSDVDLDAKSEPSSNLNGDGSVWLKTECFLPDAEYEIYSVKKQKDGSFGENLLAKASVEKWVDKKGTVLSEEFCTFLSLQVLPKLK